MRSVTATSAPTTPARRTPTQTTFDVQWKPQTVVLDKDLVSRTYRGADRSDGTLTFDSSATPIASLAPGSVVVIPGVALLRVSGVSSAGGLLHVAGKPAALDEAISEQATSPPRYRSISRELRSRLLRHASRRRCRRPRVTNRTAICPACRRRNHRYRCARDEHEWRMHAEGEVHEWKIDLTLSPSPTTAISIWISTLRKSSAAAVGTRPQRYGKDRESDRLARRRAEQRKTQPE